MKKIILAILFTVVLINTGHSQVFATFSSDTVKIWDNEFQWRCGAKFSSTVRHSSDTIYINERDTMPLFDCLCNYTLVTSITGLDVGTYTAIVTRQKRIYYILPHDTVDYNDSALVGSVTFSILNSPVITHNISLFQSPCMDLPASIHEEKFIPDKFAMLTNYPNPFNPSTIIQYTIPKTSKVFLVIYNMLGQRVAILVDKMQEEGNYKFIYNAQSLPSGVYVCRLSFSNMVLSNKMVLLK